MTYYSCLFCNNSELNYKTDKGIDYVCSGCVLLLADANQDDLKRAYIKAEAKGLKNKASALKSFIIEDEINERKAKKSKRDMERARSLRKVRPSRHKIRA
jgi:hydroxylamine reductase (hybrid-cluster protein)